MLTVYIEGDGLAWISKNRPSTNPTPMNPVGLKLALEHPSNNVAYLARPCQYVANDVHCRQSYWTSLRFAPEVLEASQQALNKLKQQFGAKRLVLVGYSGGGAIAALLAAKRDDVAKLITVAGNLDHQSWTNLHKISPLKGSLNPADYIKALSTVEQIHFVGQQDEIIPSSLTLGFVARFPISTKVKVIIIPNQSHSCCWEKAWLKLVAGL